MISSSGMLMDALRKLDLLAPQQIAQLPDLAHGRCGEARTFAKTLLQRNWLSVYQVNELLDGRGGELVIGPYHVLDKLGQGGLSQVVKARHREQKHLVAIKIIRPEVFASPEGRQQFLQEVEAMARLDHPNIVQFCDADQWNDTYYFAMEFVEGTDLGKLVRLSGALSVNEVCDYVRQAALGLQHAFERNLIHRDIKPVNLFVTFDGTPPDLKAARSPAGRPTGKSTMQLRPTIKILDWGLASLRTPRAAGCASAESSGQSMVGTVDYLAPEQAVNAAAADIRSDIYSLGCTFYFLLTAQPPFPDGTLMQKLLAHRQAEPKPIEEFRNDVPEGIIAIVRRMMAKAPEDRFQTPASAALALLSFTRQAFAANPARRNDTPLPTKLTGRPAR